MKEKLAYRSQFQPQPRRKLDDDADDASYLLPGIRRGSPYRSSSRATKQLIRNILRILTVVLSVLLIDRMTNWRSSQWFNRIVRGNGTVKTEQQWRQSYDSLELALPDLPLSRRLPSGDEIPTVALGTWKSKREDVGAAVKVRNNPVPLTEPLADGIL